MRQLLSILLCLVLVGGSVAATLGTLQLRDFELRGYVDATQDHNLPFRRPRAGINAELLQYSPDELRLQLETMRGANFRWLRQFARWDEIEPRQGLFEWSGWDALVEQMRAIPELELVAVFMNTPAWARPQHPTVALTETAPPADLDAFARFASQFAARYGGTIDYFQIWDEPNLGDAWGGLDPRPADYVALLGAAGGAILRSDPTATIVAAALAPTTETAGQNISDIRYLQAMYDHGARDLMDIAAGKPYGFEHSPLDRRVDESLLNFSRFIALREVMLANGDGRKPLWASNFGWNTLPPDWQGDKSIWEQVSQEERSSFTLQAIQRAGREWPWLGAMFLQHWQPDAPLTSAQWGFALVQPDGRATPLLNALPAVNAEPYAQDGIYHARNPYARYSGIWQFSERGADIGWLTTSDSQLAFDFFGRDVAMLVNEDNYVAFLYPQVDGEPANAAQHDADGNAYIFLRSNNQQPQTTLAPVARELPLGEHTLTAVADQGWDRWAIAGYAVSSGNLAEPYNRQIALGILTSLVSLAALFTSLAKAPWAHWLPRISAVTGSLSATMHLLLTGLTSLAMMLAMLLTWGMPKPALFLRDEFNLLLALATGGLLYFSPSLLLSLLFGLVLFVLLFQRLENGLILTVVWAPFFLYPVELHTFAFPMVEVMILLTTAAGLLRGLTALGARLQMRNAGFPLFTWQQLRHVHWLDALVLCLVGLGVASLLWTRQLSSATTELRTLIFEPALFYLLIRCTRPDRFTLMRYFLALIAAAVLVSIIGLVQYFLGDMVIVAEAGTARLQSVYGSPNNIGLLFGRTIPIALALLLAPPSARLRVLAGVSLLIMLPTLALTQSVGAILLGVPAGLAVVCLGCYGRRALLPLLGASLAGAAGFGLLTQISARFASLLDIGNGTTFVRLRLWESALSMIRDHPLTGIGLDQFLYLYGGEYLRPDAVHDSDLSHPHNFALDFWTRLSLLGLLAFIAIQALFWRLSLRALRDSRGRDKQIFAMTVGLMGSMAGLLAHGLIDNSVFVIDLAFIFMFQLAAMLRLRELAALLPARD
ncbi:MAG: O-antigen ligase family protein [Chloroflexi bacterium]|nr:O-antigen ligase family protein [Chloroflexota bacterium]